MAATEGGGGNRVVLWFRNDLRVRDNVIVHEAAQRVKAGKADEVLPVYCFDPRQFIRTPYGHVKTGYFRAKFLLESVLALQESLRAVGSDLLIAKGTPENVLTEIAEALPAGFTVVLTQKEVTSEESRVDAKVRRALKAHKGRLETHWGPTMYHEEDLPLKEDYSDMPTVFTPFKQKVESKSTVRKPLPPPSKGALPLKGLPQIKSVFAPKSVEDVAAVLPEDAPPLEIPQTPTAPPSHEFKGGEGEALARLQHYLWDTDAIADYFNTRNGMINSNDSTKFSPWLALGCIHPRTIYEEVKKYESQRTANKSTYWVIFELTWRDYYRFFTMRFGDAIFKEYGIVDRKVDWRDDPEALQRWKEGRTGLPLVDANMREMAQTGYMSNRGRQNVASYLALDLAIDWRHGADWFESALVDYDVCSNWGNWVAAAGMTGGRLNQFNITKQSKDYDEDGDYIKKWIPELKSVPKTHIHEPWRINPADRQHMGCADYPEPIPGTRYTGGGGGGAHHGGGHGGPYHGRGHDGRTHRHEGGGRGGGRGGRGGGRSRGPSRPKSQFDMYG